MIRAIIRGVSVKRPILCMTVICTVYAGVFVCIFYLWGFKPLSSLFIVSGTVGAAVALGVMWFATSFVPRTNPLVLSLELILGPLPASAIYGPFMLIQLNTSIFFLRLNQNLSFLSILDLLAIGGLLGLSGLWALLLFGEARFARSRTLWISVFIVILAGSLAAVYWLYDMLLVNNAGRSLTDIALVLPLVSCIAIGGHHVYRMIDAALCKVA